MSSRAQKPESVTHHAPPDTHRIAALRRKGWSWRRAAAALGCSYTHLAHMLTGRRESASLAARIDALPASEQPYRASGFAARRERIGSPSPSE